MKPWLVIDTNNMLWRTYYARPANEPREILATLLTGLAWDLLNLCDRFQTDRLVFCFDRGRGLRKDLSASYKAKRSEEGGFGSNDLPSAIASKKETRKIINEFRDYHIPDLGYHNVFHADGFEADDCIASVVQNGQRGGKQRFILISDDQDLYQLLSPNVSMYKLRRKQTYTFDAFQAEHNIMPHLWPQVKALGGCRTDGINGPDGIGEVIATQFFNHTLPPGGERFRKCCNFVETDLYVQNLRLAKVPFPGCPDLLPTDGGMVGPPHNTLWDRLTAKLDLAGLDNPAGRKRPKGVKPRS